MMTLRFFLPTPGHVTDDSGTVIVPDKVCIVPPRAVKGEFQELVGVVGVERGTFDQRGY